MNDRPADVSLERSRLLEQAMRELKQMACTEACVSGLCDICLAQEECFCQAEPRSRRVPQP